MSRRVRSTDRPKATPTSEFGESPPLVLPDEGLRTRPFLDPGSQSE